MTVIDRHIRSAPSMPGYKTSPELNATVTYANQGPLEDLPSPLRRPELHKLGLVLAPRRVGGGGEGLRGLPGARLFRGRVGVAR
ncbi:hypothetical protein MLP_48770 [Microlunatus phosphovorus NM-1]|uniref:Uncharacterized protein n=1 Tax=Microlunatus phosphovorus (strain ATCC 700054 / DSM 10555 / JCM 9379 / NBRC 101784 / NCIMB 13414 / VKM Ac-1990 / NM-1) TaxID=1032480 RepID=F5XFV7_MICPN|nr:hypothetical protein MLP_48770 [Microlunatus phosphovorus NM-1]